MKPIHRVYNVRACWRALQHLQLSYFPSTINILRWLTSVKQTHSVYCGSVCWHQRRPIMYWNRGVSATDDSDSKVTTHKDRNKPTISAREITLSLVAIHNKTQCTPTRTNILHSKYMYHYTSYPLIVIAITWSTRLLFSLILQQKKRHWTQQLPLFAMICQLFEPAVRV